MKVRCKQITNIDSDYSKPVNPWLEIGKEYVVLAISIPFNSPMIFRLISDDDNSTPAIFEADQFEVTSVKIPSSWIIYFNEDMELKLAPEKWLRSGFWIDFFDGEKTAIHDFDFEAKRIAYEADFDY